MSYSIDRGEKGYRVRSKRAKVGEEVFDGGFVPVPAFYSASYLIHSFIYSCHLFYSFIQSMLRDEKFLQLKPMM